MSKIRALRDRIIVRIERNERVTSGGIILPTQVNDHVIKGVVLSVGGKVTWVKVGARIAVSDRVVIFPNVKVSKALTDENLLLLQEADILWTEGETK